MHRLKKGKTVGEAIGVKSAKRHKYGAIPTVVNGIRFDSKAESRRYTTLKELEKAGKISELKVHDPCPLHVNGKAIGKLILDFSYLLPDGTRIYEDVKSKPTITALFRWKAKHFTEEYGFAIQIVTSC